LTVTGLLMEGVIAHVRFLFAFLGILSDMAIGAENSEPRT